MSIMDQLTERQIEIMQRVVTGVTQKEAAHDLGLSKYTVRNQLVRARKATGCQSTFELAVKFYLETVEVGG